MKEFSFEYGSNRRLKAFVDDWKQHYNYKGFIVYGESGVGKTTLLKELNEQLSFSKYINGYAVGEIIYKSIKALHRSVLPVSIDTEVILIDDADEILRSEKNLYEFDKMLKRAFYRDGEDRLIICSFVNQRLAEEFATRMRYELIILKPVHPNLRIVKSKAKEVDVKLSREQLLEFSDFDTMLELRSSFVEIHGKLMEGR